MNRPSSYLLVEDNDLDVEKITRGLRKIGVDSEVVRAKNGYEALEILQNNKVDQVLKTPFVVLLDINMPQMNGIEFLSALRSDPSLCHTPVFILTTSDRQADIEDAYKNNVNGYIVKPVGVGQMYESLSKLDDYWTMCELPEGRR